MDKNIDIVKNFVDDEEAFYEMLSVSKLLTQNVQNSMSDDEFLDITTTISNYIDKIMEDNNDDVNNDEDNKKLSNIIDTIKNIHEHEK